MLFKNGSFIEVFALKNPLFVNTQASIAILGIICNVLAICVFQRKGLKNKSYSMYWKSIACFDSWIHVHSLRHWLKYSLDIDIDLISPFFCRFNEYQPLVACTIGLLLESLVTLDRYFIIVYRNRFNVIKRKWFQLTSVSLIVVYSLLANIIIPFNYRLDDLNGTWICHISNREWQINSTILIVNIVCVTFIVNPILVFKIIYHIVSSRRSLRRRKRRLSVRDRKFAMSAIGLNMNSFVAKLTLLVTTLFSSYVTTDKANLIFTICYCIVLIEKSDILIINLLVNSIFRHQFLSMIGLKGASSTRIDNELLMSSSIAKSRRAVAKKHKS